MSILGLSFNNLITNLSCATEQGYIVYGLNPTLEKKLFNQTDGGVGIMKIYNKTNMSILIGGGTFPFMSEDKIVLRDESTKQNLVEIDMREQIKNAIIIKDKIISILERKICLFDWSGSHIDSKMTYSNDLGLCEISSDNERPVLVTLGTKKGEIAVWKIRDDIYKTIEAHKSNIEALTISGNGKFVGTASETGTVIRIYNTNNYKLEYEFRRGSFQAKIHNLCFNKDCNIMACCSSNGTIHLFELYNDINQTKNIQSLFSGMKDYLPTYFGSQWGFKQIDISDGIKTICGFDESNDLHIATFEGKYFRIKGKDNQFEEKVIGNLHINNK